MQPSDRKTSAVLQAINDSGSADGRTVMTKFGTSATVPTATYTQTLYSVGDTPVTSFVDGSEKLKVTRSVNEILMGRA